MKKKIMSGANKNRVKRLVCPNCGEPDNGNCACTRNKCLRCGQPVGNITFTFCDKCWEKEKKGEPMSKANGEKMENVSKEFFCCPAFERHIGLGVFFKSLNFWRVKTPPFYAPPVIVHCPFCGTVLRQHERAIYHQYHPLAQ